MQDYDAKVEVKMDSNKADQQKGRAKRYRPCEVQDIWRHSSTAGEPRSFDGVGAFSLVAKPDAINMASDGVDELAKQFGVASKILKLRLTKREIDCCRLLIFSYPASQIAKQLNISIRTVEYYISQIKVKLNCENKYQLSERLRECLRVAMAR